MPEFATVEELLKEIMREQGMTAPELAQKSGVKLRTLNSYLQGERSMSAETGIRLFGVLGWDEATYWTAVVALATRASPELYALATEQRVKRIRERQPDLAKSVREYLAELRLRLTRLNATDEEIGAAIDLLGAPQLAAFYRVTDGADPSEEDLLRGMRHIVEGLILTQFAIRDFKRNQTPQVPVFDEDKRLESDEQVAARVEARGNPPKERVEDVFAAADEAHSHPPAKKAGGKGKP